jgi:hypothetical protein
MEDLTLDWVAVELADPLAEFMIHVFHDDLCWDGSLHVEPLERIAGLLKTKGREVPKFLSEAIRMAGEAKEFLAQLDLRMPEEIALNPRTPEEIAKEASDALEDRVRGIPVHLKRIGAS